MRLVYEHCSPSDLHPKQIAALENTDLRWSIDESRVDLVVARHFESSVRSRLATEEERMMFTAERGFGTVAGKTINHADGTHTIVLQAKFLTRGTADAVELIRGLIAHEMAHLAIAQRDGITLLSYERLGIGGHTHRAFMLGLASKVIEEMRVERLVYRKRIKTLPSQAPVVEQTLRDTRAALAHAISPGPSELRILYDPRRPHVQVGPARQCSTRRTPR